MMKIEDEFNRSQALALDAENKALMAEIKRLKAERDHWESEAHNHAYDSVDEVERLQAALKPFCEADWYALGNGSFEGIVTGAVLDEAKRINQQSPAEK